MTMTTVAAITEGLPCGCRRGHKCDKAQKLWRERASVRKRLKAGKATIAEDYRAYRAYIEHVNGRE